MSKAELSFSGIFYRTRDDWIRHVIALPKDQLSNVGKLVAVRIATSINPKGRRYVLSQARIAEDLDCCERVVKRAISDLRKMGLIDILRVPIEGSTKHFNSYAIVAVQNAVPEENN